MQKVLELSVDEGSRRVLVADEGTEIRKRWSAVAQKFGVGPPLYCFLDIAQGRRQ